MKFLEFQSRTKTCKLIDTKILLLHLKVSQFMKQSSIASGKKPQLSSPYSQETKQNENQLAMIIICIAVVGLILFSFQ